MFTNVLTSHDCSAPITTFYTFQFNFGSGSGDVIYVPTDGVDNVWMIVFEFTPFIPGKSFFLFYDLIIEACCEGVYQSFYYLYN